MSRINWKSIKQEQPVTPWHKPTGADLFCAWQSAGATSYAASLVNIIDPGTNNLATATPPEWSASDGWTSYVEFDAITPVSSLPISYIWYGYVGTAEPSFIWAGDWYQMTGFTATNGILYIGNNFSTGGRYGEECLSTNPIKLSVIYVKNTDNSQLLYINGSEVNGGIPQEGGAPWSYTIRLATANAAGCLAAGVAKCALTPEQAKEIHERLCLSPANGGATPQHQPTCFYADPDTLAASLCSAKMLPGDKLYLRGGVYDGDFVCTLSGAAGNPITIEPYQDEKPVIDGSLVLNGQYQLWKNIEVMYSGWTTRTSTDAGSTPSDLPVTKKLLVNGIGHILSGMIIHDLAQTGMFTAGTLSTITGCLIYNIGWDAPDRGHGHSLYIQNTTPRKLVKRSISCNSFGWPWCAYTENARIDYIDYIETTCINAGKPCEGMEGMYPILVGGGVKAVNPRWYRNMAYNSMGNIGYISDAGAEQVVRVGNYLPFGCAEYGVTYTEDSGNTLTKPTGGIVQFCYQDEYNPVRGFLTVFNWDLAASVTANLKNITGLAPGDTVRLRCAEDYHNCYQDLVLDANKCVAVDMLETSHTIATAIGHDYTPETTYPELGCWVVEKTNSQVYTNYMPIIGR